MALTKVIGEGVGSLGTSSLTHGSDSGDTRFTLNSANQYTMVIKKAGDIAGQIGGGGADVLRFSNAAGATIMEMNAGQITKPLQPAFYAVVNSSQDNIATGQWHAIIFGLERFDSNADFNNSNGTFIAPVTGKYQFNTSIRLTAADTAANAYLFRLNGSNRTPIANYDGNQYATDTEITVQLSALLDMDANDTVTVELYQDGGTAQTDIQNGEYSFFNGILVG